MASNHELDLQSIITKHFENDPSQANELINKLNEGGNKPVKEGFENLLDKLQRCKTVQEDYRRKHEEITELKSNCDYLVGLIKSKLSVDKEIMKELIEVFSKWSTDPDFKQQFSIRDEELGELKQIQGDLLQDINKAIEALNQMNSQHQLPIIDIENSEELERLLEKVNDPEKSWGCIKEWKMQMTLNSRISTKGE